MVQRRGEVMAGGPECGSWHADRERGIAEAAGECGRDDAISSAYRCSKGDPRIEVPSAVVVLHQHLSRRRLQPEKESNAVLCRPITYVLPPTNGTMWSLAGERRTGSTKSVLRSW